MRNILFLLNLGAGLSDLSFDFLRWLLLGVACSGGLTALLAVLRKRVIGPGGPSGVWRTAPELLVWLVMTAFGTAGTLVGAGSARRSRVDVVVMEAVDLYFADAQKRLSTAFVFGKHHGRRDTLRQRVHDLLGADVGITSLVKPLGECVRALRLRLAQYPWPLRVVATPMKVRCMLSKYTNDGLCLPTRSPVLL